MGARRLGFVTYLVTVFALVTCTFHGDAAETTDLLVTQVQDALATHASGDVDAALEKYDALTADTDSFGRLSPNAASSVLNNAGGDSVQCRRHGWGVSVLGTGRPGGPNARGIPGKPGASFE